MPSQISPRRGPMKNPVNVGVSSQTLPEKRSRVRKYWFFRGAQREPILASRPTLHFPTDFSSACFISYFEDAEKQPFGARGARAPRPGDRPHVDGGGGGGPPRLAAGTGPGRGG